MTIFYTNPTGIDSCTVTITTGTDTALNGFVPQTFTVNFVQVKNEEE
jgi:hypothetical protein